MPSEQHHTTDLSKSTESSIVLPLKERLTTTLGITLLPPELTVSELDFLFNSVKTIGEVDPDIVNPYAAFLEPYSVHGANALVPLSELQTAVNPAFADSIKVFTSEDSELSLSVLLSKTSYTRTLHTWEEQFRRINNRRPTSSEHTHFVMLKGYKIDVLGLRKDDQPTAQTETLKQLLQSRFFPVGGLK